MSGHNKWSKVKHKKAATDAKKSKIFTKHVRAISVEAKKSGGDRNAPGLRAAIERARADSMPNDNIDRAIEKGSGADATALEEVIYETYGPGGVAILIVALTDNRNRTGQEIKHLLLENGCALGTPGSASWAFTKQDGCYLPNAPMALSDKDGENLGELIEALEENDDVQEVVTSADDDQSS